MQHNNGRMKDGTVWMVGFRRAGVNMAIRAERRSRKEVNMVIRAERGSRKGRRW